MGSLTIDALPANVAEVVNEVARYLGVTPELLFVADHNHEGLREGAYSIAYEGQYDWPFYFTDEVFQGNYTVSDELWLESGTGWFLAVYPNADC